MKYEMEVADGGDRFLDAAKRYGALPCPFCGLPATAGMISGDLAYLFHCSGKRTGGVTGGPDDCPGTKASANLQVWNTRNPK